MVYFLFTLISLSKPSHSNDFHFPLQINLTHRKFEAEQINLIELIARPSLKIFFFFFFVRNNLFIIFYKIKNAAKNKIISSRTAKFHGKCQLKLRFFTTKIEVGMHDLIIIVLVIKKSSFNNNLVRFNYIEAIK